MEKIPEQYGFVGRLIWQFKSTEEDLEDDNDYEDEDDDDDFGYEDDDDDE